MSERSSLIFFIISAGFSVLCTLALMERSLAMENDPAIHDNEYRLGVGDSLKIQVFGEPDLNVETRIGEKGLISYPFLGTIKVLNMTSVELERYIIEGLKGDYLVNPEVAVYIMEYRKFFVNGEVRSPGGFPFQPGITVIKAISLAGGFSERASKDKIYIVRDGGTESKPVKAKLDTRISPGDIITVEESFF